MAAVVPLHGSVHASLREAPRPSPFAALALHFILRAALHLSPMCACVQAPGGAAPHGHALCLLSPQAPSYTSLMNTLHVSAPYACRRLVEQHPAVLTDDIAARFLVGLGSGDKAYQGIRNMVEWVSAGCERVGARVERAGQGRKHGAFGMRSGQGMPWQGMAGQGCEARSGRAGQSRAGQGSVLTPD